jgi:type I restriction enzyme S subunit
VNGSFSWDRVPFVQASAEQADKYRLRSGDIVIARTGATTGANKWIEAPPEAVFASYLVRLRISSATDSRFVGYLLKDSRFKDYVRAVTGDKSAQPNASATTLVNAPLRIPAAKTTQRAIAVVLGALDDKIAVNERIARTADELTLVLASDGRWENRVRLDEICSLRKEQVVPQELVDDAVDHYSLPAFDTNKLPERVSPESIKSGKFTLVEPVVLLSKLNPDIPRVWNVTPNPEVPSLASTEFLVLAPRGSLTTHELWAVTGQQRFLDLLTAKVTGTSKSHQRVRPAEVMATEVVDPRQFGETGEQIRSLAGRAALARRESQALTALRDALLPQLMSGRLRVKDAEKIVEDHA